jgi:hypothetical protein
MATDGPLMISYAVFYVIFACYCRNAPVWDAQSIPQSRVEVSQQWPSIALRYRGGPKPGIMSCAEHLGEMEWAPSRRVDAASTGQLGN